MSSTNGSDVMKNLLCYYGWPSSFNSAINQWSTEKVARDMARYDLVVLGSGLEEDTHGDHTNTETIISRLSQLRSDGQVFGYVTVNQTMTLFMDKVDKWFAMGVDGIFLDEAGYDYGTVATNGREAFNDKLDYLHSKGLIAFVNAWKPEHVLGSNADASYPDTTWNPNEVNSNITPYDWYLMESFGICNGTYESQTQWVARCEALSDALDEQTVKVAAVGIIDEADSTAQAKFNFLWISAFIAALDGCGSSDLLYGASSANTTMWSRVNIPFNAENPRQGDGALAFMYCEGGRLVLDFSTGSETAQASTY